MLKAIHPDDHSCQCDTNIDQAVELMQKVNFIQALPYCEQAIVETCTMRTATAGRTNKDVPGRAWTRSTDAIRLLVTGRDARQEE